MRSRSQRRGSAAVEFAITLPLMALIVFGAVETSLLIHETYVVARAARDGCRMGALVQEGPDPTGLVLRQAAENQALASLEAAGFDCSSVPCSTSSRWFLDTDDWYRLTVTVTVPSATATQYLPWTATTVTGDFTMLTRTQGPVPDDP